MRLLLCGLLAAVVAQGAAYVGNEACRPCHPAIVRSYSLTAMARSSGRVVDTPAGRFRPRLGETEYRIDGQGRVSFSDSVRQLEWFIGSGSAGRSFLRSLSGHLYQAPVTYYSQRATWDLSPGYEGHTSPRWNRAVDSNCLFCHASQARPVYGTQNKFADPPWSQDGVGCERCHGPGSDHVAFKGRMVNPAKLDAERRDAICSQCHLSGVARIAKPDRSIAMFRPGDRLREYVSYFVPSGPADSAVKATGYVEKLQASRCKEASGDKLWCGTCHDSHSVPTPQEAAAFFRAKCLTCHTVQQCSRGQDCRSCHLPRAKAVDGGHGVLTDHSIPRRSNEIRSPRAPSWELRAFAGFDGSERELALAYAEAGLRTGNVRQLNEAARRLDAVPGDGETWIRLADLSSRRGARDRALLLYNKALQASPNSVTVLVNLGALEAERGNTARAVELWLKALQSDPGLAEAATNLELLLPPGEGTAQAAVRRAKRMQSGHE